MMLTNALLFALLGPFILLPLLIKRLRPAPIKVRQTHPNKDQNHVR